ncbi:Involucrin-like 1 [Homarus americanus]|uniref:Involucrin-like 1 n=1 Tax=Homarus americanus TaxID=6706 RepID=A0A8J5K674_HOMAM|nr:Involucrin-like 1 [Homarus americanus]
MYMDTRANLDYWSTDNCCVRWSLKTGACTIGTVSLIWQALMVAAGVMMLVECPVTTNLYQSNDTLALEAGSVVENASVLVDSVSNVSVPEYSASNVSVPEYSVSNVSVPEYSASNVSVPEYSASNVSVPEYSASNVSVPEYSASNVNVPEYSVSIVSVSEHSASNVSVPEYSASNVSVPEYSASKVNVPEYSASKVSVPEYNVNNVSVPEDSASIMPVTEDIGNNSSNSGTDVNFSCPWLPGPETEVLGINDKEKFDELFWRVQQQVASLLGQSRGTITENRDSLTSFKWITQVE